MPTRGSPLASFLLDALMSNTYPSRLFWFNRNESIFCLRCICKHSRGWTPADFKIFEDYHNLRTRKTADDMRQRFLIALRASPVIKELKDISSKEEKYYKIIGVDNPPSIEVLNGEFETDNYEYASLLDTSGEENSIEPMTVPVNEPLYATASMVADGFVVPATNDDFADNILSGIDEMEILADFDFDAFGIDVSQAVDDLVVPNATIDIPELSSIDDSQSLFNNSATGNLISYDHPPDLFDLLQIEEENTLEEENNMYPSDYDPEDDLMNSMGEKFQNLVHLQEIPNTFVGSSQCEVKGVYSVDSNAAVAKLLQQDGQHPKQLFMMRLLMKSKN